MSMHQLLQTAQSDVARQIEETSLATKPSAVRKMAAVGLVALAAAAATFSTGAQAQFNGDNGGNNYSRENSMLADSAGRIGSLVGSDAGRRSSMGGDVGRLLGVGASTAVKALTGQKINGADIGGTVGQLTGAAAGFNLAGGRQASSLAKSVGVVAGGSLGAIVGGLVGRNYDQGNTQNNPMGPMGSVNSNGNYRGEMSPGVLINSNDQQSFLRSMQIFGNQRQTSYRNQSSSDSRFRPGAQISPEQAGFQGYLAQSFSRTGLPLTASGSMQMPEGAMVAVANKAMEVVKVGKAYNDATAAWDTAFMVGESPAVKNNINVAVVNTDAFMKVKMREYTESRNAAVAQGYDVRLMDGAIAQELPNLKAQTGYGFQGNYRAYRP